MNSVGQSQPTKVTRLLPGVIDQTASGRDKFYRIQRRDELATDHDLLQIVAIAERFVIEKAKPKIGIFLIHRNDAGGIDHETVLKQRTCHRGFAAEIPGSNPKTQMNETAALQNLELGAWDLEFPARDCARVTDGTRTRNSQNHNLELYH
jgi:hypothetical protein